MTRQSILMPLLATVTGIAIFSAMDAAMKGAALAAGVFTAVLLRNAAGSVIMLPVWALAGRPMAGRAAMRVHVQRAFVVSGMALLFFYGLVRLPMAEAIAISFIAPLVALYFAALILKERIRRSAILASLLGMAGVLVIGATRFGHGAYTRDAALGTAAILVSAVLYALNLVLQRKQAMLAGPVEIALVQNLFMALILALFAPWFLHWPGPAALAQIGLAAVLATIALLFLSWGYARAEAQVLVPVEYTGFGWAALFGWLRFGEPVGWSTVAGALLIVAGCLVATRTPTEQTMT